MNITTSTIPAPRHSTRARRSALARLAAVLTALPLTLGASCALAATYYIDYSTGVDTNAGTSQSAPWKRHPYMKGWAGGSTYAHAAGDRFIFKGGVSWAAATLPMTIAAGGVVGNPDYYGVDSAWYVGSSFTRPVLDAAGTATNGIIEIVNPSNITIDNLKMRDVLFTSNQGNGLITIGSAPKNIVIKNSYLHKWTLSSSLTTDDAHGGVIVSTANVPPAGIVIDTTEISNAEYAATRNNGVAIRGVQTVSNSQIHDMPTAILYASDVHGNHIYRIDYPKHDFDPAYHTNLIYMAAQTSNPPRGYIYNNVIHDVATGAGIYTEPCFYSSFGSATMYVYNNLVYNSFMSGGGVVLVDPEGGSGSCGQVYIYQNTLQQPDGAQIGMVRTLANHSGTNKIGTLVTRNNLYIGPNGEWDLSLAASSSSVNNIQVTNAAATSAGYTASNLYQPSVATSLTVDKATAISCAECVAINRDRLGVERGQGSAWDVGAYEYRGTSVGAIAPPSSLHVNP